ncbi:hypothetical protein [Paenibacillus hamazuiensis]|uniref:hypothetical protein n=1 Tax=Paenibacillus hamazuiensis TaxID=2936508 RepID=UPI00200C1F44|nr:hypothetical protein [Paenibacillus hamazuiensis]
MNNTPDNAEMRRLRELQPDTEPNQIPQQTSQDTKHWQMMYEIYQLKKELHKGRGQIRGLAGLVLATAAVAVLFVLLIQLSDAAADVTGAIREQTTALHAVRESVMQAAAAVKDAVQTMRDAIQ